MSSQPLVSVIVPAFNAAAWIGETIESILAQSYQPLEVIVVDDGSTDSTAAVIREYEPRVVYHYQRGSGGCAVPRNTGIAKSHGELLCFVDADDIITPDRIEQQVRFLKRYPDVKLVFSDYRNFDAERGAHTSHFRSCPRLWAKLSGREELILEDPRRVLVHENFGIAGSFLMRRELLRQEPGFESTLKACEDFHFYFRLARHGDVGVINRVGMLRRLHGGNMSLSSVRMLSEGVRSRTLLRDAETDPYVREGLGRFIVACHGSLGYHWANEGRLPEALRAYWRACICDPHLRDLPGLARGTIRALLIASGAFVPEARAGEAK